MKNGMNVMGSGVRYLSVAIACKITGIPKTTMYHIVKKGLVKNQKSAVDGQILICCESLQKYYDKNMCKNTSSQ